jgi:glutamyl-tRNA synthetase
VVDDIDMKITHIVRGEDHLSNSAVHNELFQSLESAPPLFGHNPLMLNEDGTKLSKRNFDSISITQFKAKGYTTNSILSYLYSVGLNTDVNFKEVAINSFADFDLSKISKNLPKLDIQKINHFQKNSLRAMDINDIKNEFSKLEDLGITEKEWNLIKDNIEIYENIIELLDIVRRKKIEIAPNKEFIKLLKNNISEIKDLKFDAYISFLIEKDNKLTKKDIFTNTRYIFTGNNNGPSVKDLYLFFGFSGLERILNEFEAL